MEYYRAQIFCDKGSENFANLVDFEVNFEYIVRISLKIVFAANYLIDEQFGFSFWVGYKFIFINKCLKGEFTKGMTARKLDSTLSLSNTIIEGIFWFSSNFSLSCKLSVFEESGLILHKFGFVTFLAKTTTFHDGVFFFFGVRNVGFLANWNNVCDLGHMSNELIVEKVLVRSGETSVESIQ